ncbi:unnamed protein product, partial [marine sediment metagenome]
MADVDFIRGFYSGVFVLGNATDNATIDPTNHTFIITLNGIEVDRWE